MKTTRPPTCRLRITTAHLLVLTLLVGIFAFLNTHPIRPYDFWWHIAIGRDIATSGEIPATDAYSFTAYGTGYPSYQMFWLPELSLYLVYHVGGPALVVFLNSLLITGAYGATLLLSQRYSRSWHIATLTTLFAAALGISDWNVRPQVFTFWLVPMFLLVIARYRERGQRGWLVLLPLGMAFWVNCHGTYPLGLAPVGLWCADEGWLALTKLRREKSAAPLRRLSTPVLALVVTATACLINPRGIGIVTYVRELSTDPAVQSLVTEWAAPTFGDLFGSIFLIGLLATAAVLTLSPRRPTPSQLLAFLAFGALGLKTSRGIIWYGLIVAPILADHLAAIVAQLKAQGLLHATNSPQHPRINALIAALLALSAVLTLPWCKSYLQLPAAKAGLISGETPVEATEFLLAAHPAGPLFHEMGFGSYLIWAAQPKYPVFVDPRIELYPLDLWLAYLTASTAQQGWQETLDRYGIRTMMLSPTTQPDLLAAARLSPEWTEIYVDASAVILTRSAPEDP